MKAIVLRPLAVFTIVFFVLSCILFTADTAVRLWSAVIFIFLFAVCTLLRFLVPAFRKRSMKSAAMIALCFFLAGAALAAVTSHYNTDVRLGRFKALENKYTEFEGVVTDVHYDMGSYAVYSVDISNANGLTDFSCVVTGQGGISRSSVIKGTATFYPLERDETFDERRYYLSRGTVISAEADSVEITGKAGFSLLDSSKDLNEDLSSVFYGLLGEDAGGFAAALMLGNKENLKKTVSRDFERLGLSHILAISGMHLTIICAFVSTILYPLGKSFGRVGCIITVIFYMIITGFSASVTRSGIMLLFLILSAFLRRGNDSFTSLGIAAFLISVIDPFACADIGLQLSFSAVFAILLYITKRKAPKNEYEDKKAPKNPAIKLLRPLFEGASLTVVIVLFMLPLEWLYFGEISVISPIASPLFSLFSTVLLWALPLLLLLSPASTMAAILAYPIKLLISFIFTLAGKLSGLRNVTVSLNYPFTLLFSILIFLCVIAFCVSEKKKRLVLGAVTLLLLLSFGLCCFSYKLPDYDRVRISMIEQKKSEGLLISSDNKVMVIDVGNGYSPVFKSVLSRLSSVQATEIEVLMLTHLHTSHPSTLTSLFSSQTVRTVVLPREESQEYYNIIELCESHGIDYIPYTCGDTLNFEDCIIQTDKIKYIKRSRQPIVRLDITAFGEKFTYLGASYVESFEEDDLAESAYVWFGDHGPLYKETFEPGVADSCEIFASDEARNYISEKITPSESLYAILD